MDKYINDIEVTASTFAFDGCHKIYLCNDAADIGHMKDCGYEDGDFYPIEDLPEIWSQSCELRFIYSADLETAYVKQGESARFEGFEIEVARRALFIDGARDGYHPDDVHETYTIRELIEHLQSAGNRIGMDAPVYLSNDRGYTYGGIAEWTVSEGAFSCERVFKDENELFEAECKDGVILA